MKLIYIRHEIYGSGGPDGKNESILKYILHIEL